MAFFLTWQLALERDPFSVEAQKKIEELIQQQNIMSNMEAALEHHPETFAQVTMLYVLVHVNAVSVKAFVDCGAQATISKLLGRCSRTQ